MQVPLCFHLNLEGSAKMLLYRHIVFLYRLFVSVILLYTYTISECYLRSQTVINIVAILLPIRRKERIVLRTIRKKREEKFTSHLLPFSFSLVLYDILNLNCNSPGSPCNQ